ncbi:MAG: hypothetical protein ACYDGN_18275 [Acidimicrobiales bacterium]
MSNPVNSRQETLTARLRCYYADPAKHADRPHCEGVGVVSYASIVLCSMCDKMRSSVGRTEAGRKLAGGELLELIDAAKELSRAEERVGRAVWQARAAGASWSQVGDGLLLSRQAVQQRFAGAAENDPTGQTCSSEHPTN